ncbi:hypothetical protein L0F63_002372, partial [Massospora cicadina]
MILSWTVFVFIVISNLKKYAGAQRLGYKIFAWVAMSDYLNNLVGLVPFDNDFTLEIDTANLISNGIYFFFDTLQLMLNTMFVLLTTCMAFNLHMVFLRGKYLDSISHWKYVKWCIFISIILPVPHFALAMYQKRVHPLAEYWKPMMYLDNWILYFVWQLAGSLYCLYVFTAVVLRLRQNRRRLASMPVKLPVSGGAGQPRVSMERFASRLVLYAAVPIITILPTFVLKYVPIDYVQGINNFIANLASILNFISFLFDPALESIYEEWVARRYQILPYGE